MRPQTTTFAHLCRQFEVVLLDVYGVLLDGHGAFPEARQAIDQLNATNKTYFILTNGSSKTVTDTAAYYRSQGLAIAADRVISSGGLLAAYFAQRNLQGSRVAILGTEGSRTLVKNAGDIVVDPLTEAHFDVLVIGNQGDFPFLAAMDATLTALIQMVEAGRSVSLILPNPDLIFPSGPRAFGFTAGTLALMIEEGLRARFGDQAHLRFTRLGKPHRPIFEEAHRRAGTMSMVLVGDQIDTDVLGARDFGIASAMVKTGLTHPSRWENGSIGPDFVLESLG